MKLFKNRKALSPVVASIILIAVTVAVSIAVAAWMGALTFTFMGTEELRIIKVEFLGNGAYINVTMKNTGTSPITLSEIWVGGTKEWTTGDTLSANEQKIIRVNLSTNWQQGNNYEIKVVTSKGNQFFYTATAPSS